MKRVPWHRGAPCGARKKICFSSDFNAWGHAIKAIKLCSQYFTAVGCFAQFYRIISFFALRKWYRNRCFVWDLSTLVKAQCGRFSRYAQLPWQQWLLPENRMSVSQRTWTPPVEILWRIWTPLRRIGPHFAELDPLPDFPFKHHLYHIW